MLLLLLTGSRHRFLPRAAGPDAAGAATSDDDDLLTILSLFAAHRRAGQSDGLTPPTPSNDEQQTGTRILLG